MSSSAVIDYTAKNDYSFHNIDKFFCNIRRIKMMIKLSLQFQCLKYPQSHQLMPKLVSVNPNLIPF